MRALCLLWHPRVRHGGGDERHGAAWRRHSLWRHIPGLCRLLPQLPSACPLCSRPALVYVMTHDSIGLGEDGPTHQPVEHLQSLLRHDPQCSTCIRPADTMETAECWEIALETANGPSLLALTRQNLPALRNDASVKPGRPQGRIYAAQCDCCAPGCADRDRVGSAHRARRCGSA